MRAVLAGDKSAYAELYDRYARLVRAICLNTTGSLVGAQDLSQEVFLRAYAKLDALRDPSRFAGWLVGITRWVCSEWRRGRMRDRHRYLGLDPAGASVEDSPASRPRFERLRKEMLSLPEKERLALHAFYLQGQSVQKARAALGLSRSGFYRVLERARKRLGRRMQQHHEDGP